VQDSGGGDTAGEEVRKMENEECAKTSSTVVQLHSAIAQFRSTNVQFEMCNLQ
jgi:hypothetical protein